jgi:hypothetical protein
VPLKMDRFVKKNVMVKNVKIILIRNPVWAGPSEGRFLKIDVLLL